jgi:hypothetical protein
MSKKPATPAPKTPNWELAANLAVQQRDKAMKALYDCDLNLSLANDTIAKLEAEIAALKAPPQTP